MNDKIEYPPNIKLNKLEEESFGGDGFLVLKRTKVEAHYPDGNVSAPFHLDTVERKCMDAVCIIAFYKEYGKPYIYLRSAVRAAIMFRDYVPSKLPEDSFVGNLFELPAGLVEVDEVGVDGLRAAAARELWEEVGYQIDPKDFNFLGKRIFSTAGLAGERIFFLSIEVDPLKKQEPTLDGHALEEGANVVAIPLNEALEFIDRGYLADAKTEIGIRRFNSSLK